MDSFLLGASASIWDCRLIRRPVKAARRRLERCLGRVTGKVFGRQKMALESTLPCRDRREANQKTERDWRQSRAQHHADYVCTVRAKRHAYANFTRRPPLWQPSVVR
jgi:hypothetical protein